jgi:sodium/bile acid cotransporter 7
MFSTFILFPILGLLFQWWHPVDVSPQIYSGFVYLCILPATVQSAIAFTSLAGGNVAAAVCSASASSLLGIFVSPLLVSLLMHVQGETGNGLEQVWHIVLQLLVPFVAGHLLRPLIGGFVERHRKMIGKTDQTSILLVVYSAFSEAVTQGIWHQVGIGSLLFIVVFSLVLLAFILVINTYMARWMGFSKPDEITIVFCGSKKSLANGIPMANILFPVSAIGMMVLPLMIFHQVQLMTCAVLAKRYQKKQQEAALKHAPVTE